MKSTNTFGGRLDALAGRLLRGTSVFFIGLLMVLLTGNVVFRFVPVISFGWFDEIVELSFAYLVFIGTAALWREKEHFAIDWLLKKTAGTPIGRLVTISVELIGLAFFIVLFWYGFDLVLRAADLSPIFKLPRRLFYACIPISALIMGLYSVRNIVEWALRPKARPSAGG